jgi:hypothetical protein
VLKWAQLPMHVQTRVFTRFYQGFIHSACSQSLTIREVPASKRRSDLDASGQSL